MVSSRLLLLLEAGIALNGNSIDLLLCKNDPNAGDHHTVTDPTNCVYVWFLGGGVLVLFWGVGGGVPFFFFNREPLVLFVCLLTGKDLQIFL